jgi:hypothetical protein
MTICLGVVLRVRNSVLLIDMLAHQLSAGPLFNSGSTNNSHLRRHPSMPPKVTTLTPNSTKEFGRWEYAYSAADAMILRAAISPD